MGGLALGCRDAACRSTRQKGWVHGQGSWGSGEVTALLSEWRSWKDSGELFPNVQTQPAERPRRDQSLAGSILTYFSPSPSLPLPFPLLPGLPFSLIFLTFPPLPSQNLERSGNQHKAEVEAIMEQLKELKQKGDRDKEALKKAIRAQKERAEKSEEYAEQLHVQLADKVAEGWPEGWELWWPSRHR